VVAADFNKPNGIAFSPDEKILYIVDTGLSHTLEGEHHIRAFSVDSAGHVSGGSVSLKSLRAWPTACVLMLTATSGPAQGTASIATLLTGPFWGKS
jgi:hypothetical protein